MNRIEKINTFYSLLEILDKKFPKRTLSELNKSNLPIKGVYFFFDTEQTRSKSKELKVIRIGTHAARANSKTTLYNRLKQHKGTNKGYGNHRGSVFRELVGFCFINNQFPEVSSWGQKNKKTNSEKQVENTVSSYLSNLLFTVIEIPGASHKDNDRAFIEKNSISLLSNYNKEKIDANTQKWLGNGCRKDKVIKSGLWNRDYVDREQIDDDFLKSFEKYIIKMTNIK